MHMCLNVVNGLQHLDSAGTLSFHKVVLRKVETLIVQSSNFLSLAVEDTAHTYTVFHTIRVEWSLFHILSHISSMLCAIGMRYISK